MKRKIFLSFVTFLVSCISLTTLTSSMPEPNYTIYDFRAVQWSEIVNGQVVWHDYADIYYSVYQICSGGFGYYNEGPLYPSETTTDFSCQNSNYLETFTTATYANIFVKKLTTSSWVSFGTIQMSQYNTTTVNGNVRHFQIRMSAVPVPEQEE